MHTFLRERRPELALLTLVLLALYAMLASSVGQTIPFHVIWISVTLVYGYRAWSLRATTVTLVLLCLTTGAAMVAAGEQPAEMTEVPLMAVVFLAMVWHSRRRQAALQTMAVYAEEQERLRDRERQFLQDAAHLLRTPVTVARGYTELLQASAVDDQAHADAALVLRELDSVSRISSRLLLLTTSELSALLVARPVDVAELLARVRARWRPTTDRVLLTSGSAGLLVADEGLLESALDALVENALRYTGPDGRVELRCQVDGQTVLLSVADDGAGVAADRLATLFDRRWSPRRPDERSGTGLGLALVKAIVEAHGGEVAVTSALGAGTTVSLRLPTGDVTHALAAATTDAATGR